MVVILSRKIQGQILCWDILSQKTKKKHNKWKADGIVLLAIAVFFICSSVMSVAFHL